MKQALSMATVLALFVAVAAGPAQSQANPDVLIIGAGLSGLSTAYYLKQAGISYHVLESTPHLGGRMRSAKYPQGVAAEAGLAEFWEGNPALDIAHALKVPTDRGDTSFSSYYYNGKLIPFTQSSNAAFLKSIFTAGELAKYQAWDKKMVGYYHDVKLRPIPTALMKLKDISFGDWMRKTSGLPPKPLHLVQTVTEPEFATSWERISALDGIAEWHIFSGKGTGNQHMQGGNQRLAEAIVKHVGPANVETNRQVTNVVTTANGVTVTAMDPTDYHFHQYQAKYVVTSMQLFRLYEIQFTPPLSAPIQESINTQTWGAYFTAHVIVDKAAKKYWSVKGESILPMLTGGPVGVVYEGETESPNHELINLLVTGDHAEIYNARTGSLDDVRRAVSGALEKQWPGFTKHIQQMTFVRYHPRAVASWPVGRSRFDEKSELLRKPYGRLYFAGDFTEGTHSDGAVHAAKRVAGQIKQALGK